MPRHRRFAPPGSVLHVVNRGNDKRQIFRGRPDYDTFLGLMSWAKQACPVRVLGYCLMPNHWHLVLSPVDDGGVGRFVHRVATTHSIRLRRQTGSVGNGHVYQQRYHATLVDSERYYFHVLRYVEANPARAKLVGSAIEWPWSSLSERLGEARGLLDPLPIPLPEAWPELVDQALSPKALAAIRGTRSHHSATVR